MKMKYLCAMLTWLYKFIGKALLSSGLLHCFHVFTELHCFIRYTLSDTPSVLELKVFWDLPSVANTRTGRLLGLGCRDAVWCTKRWIQLLLSTCTSSQLTRNASTGTNGTHEKSRQPDLISHLQLIKALLTAHTLLLSRFLNRPMLVDSSNTSRGVQSSWIATPEP